MISEATAASDLEVRIELERHIQAPIKRVFEALLDELGPSATNPDSNPMSMKIEPFPGGRWYRDLGEDNGHHWAHVQAIRHPDLLELTGPLFMSLPVSNNVQYRLSHADGTTTLSFVHTAFGPVPADMRDAMSTGWVTQLDKISNRF